MKYELENLWAVILGGSSGFGLASAQQLAAQGMNICVVHRDRRGSMARIEQSFEQIRSHGTKFCSFNLDALSNEGRAVVLNDLTDRLGGERVRLLLHSIAFGSLKLIAPKAAPGPNPVALMADKLGQTHAQLQAVIDQLFEQGLAQLHSIATPPNYNDELLLDQEEALSTIHAMGTSLLSWTQDLFQRRLFAADARVIGLTSEGNEVAWLGYAAVSAAKASLESVSRSIAKEFGVHGIRANIVQPGVTDTPALRLIPGSTHLMARAKLRNPLGRLTQVEDVARVVGLLASEQAAWINGSIIRVDGGEHISGS